MERYETSIEATVERLGGTEGKLHEYAREVLDRIEALDPEIAAFVDGTVRRERIERRYDELEERWANRDFHPPLYGVAVGVKDLFHVDGLPTRAGSSLPPSALADAQSGVITSLQDAGAVVVGKTVTTEFGHLPPGPTRNPHDLGHTPGGSSSGSAAAVAAGICPLAVGTEGVGSVIRPAAFCGIVGFRPSRGRIPVDRVVPGASSTAHIGLFTQQLSGARRAASVVCRHWAEAFERPDRLTVGVPTGPYRDQASATGDELFERHVSRLADAGFDVERCRVFDDIESINENHRTLMAFEAPRSHAEWFHEYGERYPEEMRAVLDRGRSVSIEAAGRGKASMSATRAAVEDTMSAGEMDLIVTPPACGPAPAGIDDDGDPVMNLPWTHAGVPAVTVPVETTTDGLPVGIGCIGRFGRDERLLSNAATVAAALESDSHT